MASSWGSSWLESWGNSWGVISPEPPTDALRGTAHGSSSASATLSFTTNEDHVLGGGGTVSKRNTLPQYHPWIHSPVAQKLKVEQRPEIIEAVIEAVAKVSEKPVVERQVVDTTAAAKELRAFLKSQEVRWKQEYIQLIKLEYERRAQEYEDAQIAMMLFEM